MLNFSHSLLCEQRIISCCCLFSFFYRFLFFLFFFFLFVFFWDMEQAKDLHETQPVLYKKHLQTSECWLKGMTHEPTPSFDYPSVLSRQVLLSFCSWFHSGISSKWSSSRTNLCLTSCSVDYCNSRSIWKWKCRISVLSGTLLALLTDGVPPPDLAIDGLHTLHPNPSPKTCTAFSEKTQQLSNTYIDWTCRLICICSCLVRPLVVLLRLQHS